MRLNRAVADRFPARIKARLLLVCLSFILPLLHEAPQVHASNEAFIHVAVLEPQLTADGDDRSKALAMTLDHLLASTLSQNKNVMLVDRQSLDAVVKERELALGGAAGNGQAAELANELKPFFAAGLLVVSEIDPKVRSVTVQIIVAQNGMHLGSLQWQLEKLDEPSLTQLIQKKLPGLWKQAIRILNDTQDQKTVEVAATLGDGRDRLRWLADDAVQSARAKVALMNHVALLTPRRPLVTKEERLLRVAGLSASVAGDTAATLRATPDMLVELRVSEGEALGKMFSQTPVVLHAQIRSRQDDRLLTKDFSGLAGEWDKVVDAMDQWLVESLAQMNAPAGEKALPDQAANQDDDQRAREMAAAAMANIEPWTKMSFATIFRLPVDLKLRLCEIAQRASHLDPTHESAAWLVALTMLADQETKQAKLQDENYASRVLLEMQRYMDRFGDQNPAHLSDLYMKQWVVCVGRIWHLQRRDDPEYQATHEYKSAYLEPPDPLQYEVARPYLRSIADYGVRGLTDKRFAGGNTHVVFTHSLISMLIPHIPESELQSEYEWWQNFYATRIDVLSEELRPSRHGGQVATPWELAQAAFAARRHDPAAVRRYLQIVAERYAENIESVWGSRTDKRNPYLIPILLKAAGDPAWESWKPVFGPTKELQVSLNDMTDLLAKARAQVPRVWDNDRVLPLQGLKLNIPKEVRDASDNPKWRTSGSVEAVLQTDDTIWLITPGVMPGSSEVPSTFFTAVMLAKHDQSVDVQTTALDWPNSDKAAPRADLRTAWTSAQAVTDEKGTVVFMGTESLGLLRFEQTEGKWVSQWIGSEDGLPSEKITRLASCVYQGRPALLVMSREQTVIGGQGSIKNTTAVLDIRSNEITLLNETATVHRGSVAVMKDGRRVYLTLAGSGAYAKPLVVEEIASFEPHEIGWEFKETPWPYTLSDGPGSSLRIWQPIWDPPNRTYHLFEYDGQSLKRTNGKSPGRSVTQGISVAINDHAKDVIFPITSWPGSDSPMKIRTWPSMDIVFSAGGGPILWLTLKTGAGGDRSNLLVGYRPAPLDSKNWEADDQWIGPFHTPNRQLITGFKQAQQPGQYLLSSITDVMLLDEKELEDYARKQGALQSTLQWREQYLQVLAKAGWQCQVPALMLDKQHEKALEVLDALLAGNGDADAGKELTPADKMIVQLWKARVLADMPERLADAINSYDTIATASGVTPAMEVFARGNQIVLLDRAKRWNEIIELGARMYKRFPQMTASKDTYSLAWYIGQAQKHLKDEASTRPNAVPAPSGDE